MTKYKCPDCDGVTMELNEDAHVCPECQKSLTLSEATELFDKGELIAITEEKEIDIKEVELKVDITEDFSSIIDGEELSEEFQKKAATLFESAVNQKVSEIHAVYEAKIEKQKEESEAALEEAKEDYNTELETKVDDYLDYVVTEWMESNELAIENGARAEITEDFIDGLQDLFKENFIDVPEDRFDVVTDLAEKVESLEAELDKSIDDGIKGKKKLEESYQVMIFSEIVEGMADTEVEKFKEISESVAFDNIEGYTEKLTTLKESFFKKEKTGDVDLNEEVIIEKDGEKVVEKKKDDKTPSSYDDSIRAALAN